MIRYLNVVVTAVQNSCTVQLKTITILREVLRLARYALDESTQTESDFC